MKTAKGSYQLPQNIDFSLQLARKEGDATNEAIPSITTAGKLEANPFTNF